MDVLVDGRVLTDDYPGIRDFWVPVLCAWAERGGRGAIGYGRGQQPPTSLVQAGLQPWELPANPRAPLALFEARRLLRSAGIPVTLSPLYLTLSGARRDIATVFDLIGRTHARSWRSRLLWEATLHWVLARAARIVCATRVTAAAIEQAFPSAGGRIVQVPPIAPPAAVDPAVLRRRGVAPPYVVAISSHRPHKRLAELTRCWAKTGASPPLVVIGRGTEALVGPHARGLGFLPGAEVAALLASAECLVSATATEGFGLPILAAMHAGVPVVATRCPAFEETSGEVGVWVEPDRVDALPQAVTRLLSDPVRRQQAVAGGRARARHWTAERAAAAFQALLTEAARS